MALLTLALDSEERLRDGPTREAPPGLGPSRPSCGGSTRVATPKPGQRVRGSDSGQPIMALLDLLGRRWALRIGWELREGPLRFRELQRRCEMVSPNLLTTRLREGLEAGTIEKRSDGTYGLTARGQALLEALQPLKQWASDWARDLG